MAVGPVILARGAVPTSPTQAFALGTIDTKTITEVVWTNTTAGALTVNLYVVPSGQTASVNNAVYYLFSLPANSVTRDQYNLLLVANDSVWWTASGAGVNGYITGTQVPLA